MDNFEYLNQISKSARPAAAQSQKSALFSSPIFKFAILGIIAFFFLMIVGSMLGSLSNKTSDLTKQLYLRSTNLNTVLTTNNKLIKSSQLRAIGLSLATVINNSTRELSSYLSPEGSKDKTALTPSTQTTDSETEILNQLQTTLDNARLNGILDRIYSNQIGLQVSLLMSLISELGERTNDDQLRSILETYYSNLSPIHDSLQNYSDAAS